MRAALANNYWLVKPVADEAGDDTAFQALSERDRVIAWRSWDLVDGFGADQNLDKALDEAVSALAEIFGWHYPEDLAAYAARQAQIDYHRALRRDETEELIAHYERQWEMLTS